MQNEKRIEKDVSRTAEMTCSIRAASFYEKNVEYKSDDYIAPRLLPVMVKLLIKVNLLKRFLIKEVVPTGIYEYVIARTKYVDEILDRAISEGFQQVFIFGAGFDSRSVRFAKSDIAFFESDTENIREAKFNQYRKRKIKIPDNLTFIPVNYDKEKIEDKIKESCFDKNKKTLFIMEGLTMYLQPKAVDDLIKVIRNNSINNNWIVADFIYKSVLNKENKYFGEEDIYFKVDDYNETWTFGLDDDNIIQFFSDRKLKVIEIAYAEKLEEKYFNNHNYEKNIINGTHFISWLKTA